jgi:hypothetical protein
LAFLTEIGGKLISTSPSAILVKSQPKTAGIIGKFDVTCGLDKGKLIADMGYFSTTGKLFWNAEQKMDESLP